MADRRLRELERRRAAGGLDAEVDLIRARLRAGHLELGLLGLAAHLGHPAARAALGDRAPEQADRGGWPEGWAEEAARMVDGGPVEDRIWFPGNPWPAGHRFEELAWSGRLDPEQGGLWFDLHLKTVAYYAEDGDDDEEDEDLDAGDWQAKIVWGNYHACTLSTTNWHDGGWQVGTAEAPFDWSTLGAAAFCVDDQLPPEDIEDLAFHVYLLGHDSAGDHRIVFTPLDDGMHRLEWSGRLAQTYVGSMEFCYRFYARASRVRFAGFRLPRSIKTPKAAKAAFAELVTDPSAYRLVTRGGDRHFVPR